MGMALPQETRLEHLQRIVKTHVKENDEIQQMIAEALDYPRYCDDLKTFPSARPDDGYLIGEHVTITLVMELVREYKKLKEICK